MTNAYESYPMSHKPFQIIETKQIAEYLPFVLYGSSALLGIFAIILLPGKILNIIHRL